jgi:hypothetical protein
MTMWSVLRRGSKWGPTVVAYTGNRVPVSADNLVKRLEPVGADGDGIVIAVTTESEEFCIDVSPGDARVLVRELENRLGKRLRNSPHSLHAREEGEDLETAED